MKKKFFFSFLFSFSVLFVLAQTTPAENQQKLDEAKKKAEPAMSDPKVKATMEQAKK